MTQAGLSLIQGLGAGEAAGGRLWHGTGTDSIPIPREGRSTMAIRAAIQSDARTKGEVDPVQAELSAAELLRTLHGSLEPERVVQALHESVEPALGQHGFEVRLSDGRTIAAGQPRGVALEIPLPGPDSPGRLVAYLTRSPNPGVEPLLHGVAEVLYQPLVNALRHQEALEAARRDPLTGAPNRGAFDETLPAEVEMARRHRLPLALLVIDVDGFKGINDHHGHLAGDRLLKHVAGVLRTSERVDDLTFRYAGDEFVVLLRHTDEAGAQRVAGRLAEAVRDTPARLDSGATVPLRISVGCAALRGEETATELFRRADLSLLAAKGYGSY